MRKIEDYVPPIKEDGLNTEKDITLGGGAGLVLGTESKLYLNTALSTDEAVGLIQLQYNSDDAKAIIEFRDKNDTPQIWLQAHDYLTYPSNQHKHFSIEASDDDGELQTRLGVGYGADVIDVTVNQADLKVNRNTGMTNGNIVMTGGGGGGTIKHDNDLDIYPDMSSQDGTHALRISIGTGSDPTISAIGGTSIRVDDSLIVNGSLRISTGAVPSTSSSTGILGQIAYDSSYLYICVATNTWRRTALSTW